MPDDKIDPEGSGEQVHLRRAVVVTQGVPIAIELVGYSPGAVTVRVLGVLTAATVAVFREAMDEYCTPDRDLVLDFEGVTECSRVGMAELQRCRRRHHMTNGRRVVIAGATGGVSDYLDRASMTERFRE